MLSFFSFAFILHVGKLRVISKRDIGDKSLLSGLELQIDVKRQIGKHERTVRAASLAKWESIVLVYDNNRRTRSRYNGLA